MNIKNLFLLFLCLTMQDLAAKGSKKKSITPEQTAQKQVTTTPAQQSQNDLKKQQAQAAAAVFSPDMPTNSIHEKTIEQIYGPTGLNIAKQDLTYIKNSYCYLEFLVKIDQVKNNQKYLEYQATDFKDFMQSPANNKALMPTENLVQSSGWKAVEITAQDLIASAAWQNFIKAMICDSFDNDKDFIIDTTQTNNQIFPYLPNIETSYQTNDFTSLRLYQESIQLQTFLQDRQRKQYLAQTKDWTDSGKIQEKIAQFKKSDFYNFTHNAQATKPKKDPQTGAQIPVVITSPVREQIVCYFMLMYVQITINDMLNTDNAIQFLTQANSAQLTPNFFVYGPSDFVYIQDMLTLEMLSDKHAKNPNKSAIIMTYGTNEAPEKNATTKISAAQSPAAAGQQSVEDIKKQMATVIFQKLPITSKYEKTIDKIYGSQGLNLTQELIDHIKKTYCYLEFLVKVEKVKNDKKYKQYQKTDFKDFMQSKAGDNALMPTQALVSSPGWQAINYNDTDITTNFAWQMFLKAMICDIYDTQDEFVLDLLTVSDQIVDDLGSIEDCYTSDEFTQIRLVHENMILDQVVLQNQQKSYLEQCLDWKKLNQKDLIAAITQFKKTDFYNLTHNDPSLKTKEQANTQYSSIASPTKEQLISYYTLLSIQTEVYNLLTLENLASFLTAASSPELSPNFFAYTPSDYIYLYDNLMLNDLIDANKKALQGIETFDLDDADDTVDQNKNDDEVVIQSAANDLKKMNRASAKSLKKMNSGTKKSLKKMNAGTKKSLRKMNKATRRNVKKMNRIIAKRWKKNQKLILAVILTVVIVVAVAALIVCTGGAASPVLAPLIAAGNGLFAAGAAAGTAVAGAGAAVGSAAVATGSAFAAGTTAGIATGAAVGASVGTSIGVGATVGAAVGGTVGGLSGGLVAVAALASSTAFAAAGGATITAGFASGGVAGAVAATGGMVTVAALSAPLTAAMIATGIGLGIAAAADHKLGMQMMAGMMQGMEAMTDALTTGFIEMSVGLTYFGASIAQGLGYPVNAKLEMHKVKAKMEKYRSSINMAMSIVITIVMTVAVMCVDAQLAVYAMGAARAGWLGSTVSGVVLANDAAIAAGTVVAKQAALTIAKASADDAAKAVAQATAKVNAATGQSAAEQAATKAAQKTLEAATKTLAEKQAAVPAAQAALDAAEIAAKQTALVAATSNSVTTATKTLAEKQAAELAAQTALKKAIEKGADKAIQQGLQDAIVKATAEKQAAQTSLNSVKELAELEAKKLVTLKTSQQTAQEIAKMQAQADAAASKQSTKAAQLNKKVDLLKSRQAIAKQEQTAKFAVEKESIISQSDDVTKEIIKKETQALDDKLAQSTAKQRAQALEYAEKKNAKASKDTFFKKLKGSSKKADDMTLEQAIVKKEAKRIEALTISEQAQQQGLGVTLKNNIMTTSFALGQIINGAMGIFTTMATAHQDEMAAQAAEEEKQSIQKLWKFVEDTKVNTAQTQQLFLDELHKKHRVAVENQAFGLQYYENFLHGSINNVQDQISQALAQQQIALLTPNKNGLRPADIGSTWGLQTAFTYLYPSQGFISTTLGRPEFPYAQEVAQAPLTSTSNSKTQVVLADDSSGDAKLWFNQKAITTINQSVDMPLDVEIKFRIIYKLTSSYHVGLYLGGNYQDYNSPAYLQELLDNNRIDIAQAHLAKMFVLKRDDKDVAPSVGVYEHEGKGWMARQPLDAKAVDTASIYHMRAHLEKDQLTVSFWQENNPSEKWSQTMTVKPTDQRTFGVIFSGLAIEWNVVKPILKIQENKAARAASNGQSEIARERASKAQWKKLMEPQLGFMKIRSLGKVALLQGHYLYTTQDTNLVDEKNNPITDYVIFASASGDQITNLGQSPQPTESGSQTPNAIVSLLTGNVYNSSRKIIARKDNMLVTYLQTNKLAQPILDEIYLASNTYAKAQKLAEQTNKTPQESIVASQTVSLADLINPAPPEVGGVQLGLTSAAPAKIVAPSVTISQLQNLAAGPAGLAL